MRFGLDVAQQRMPWDEVVSRVQFAEQLGFDGAWGFDHLQPMYGDGPGEAFEGMTTLAALAGVTSRIRLGLLVTGATYRHPSVFATQAMTIDHASHGRLELSLGAAWFDKEHRELGIPFPSTSARFDLLEDALEIVLRLFTGGVVSYEGRVVSLHDAQLQPQPVQRPHPPIWIGGNGPRRTLPLVARYADVWHAWGTPGSLRDVNGRVDELAVESGRDPAAIMRASSLSLDDLETARKHAVEVARRRLRLSRVRLARRRPIAGRGLRPRRTAGAIAMTVHGGEQRAESGPVDVIVVGAGITGIYQLYRAREAGFSARLLEAGGGVGGTWYWNRYPGARFDSESYTYAYIFSQELFEEWEWREHFADQPEIERYLNYVVDRFDLRRDMCFGVRVTSAVYGEPSGTWTVTAADGTVFRSRFLVASTGVLSVPFFPDVPGREDFGGEQHHTGLWPAALVDFKGKRVAVIGTGSSGVQIIPAIAGDVASLTVYQRRANWCTPLNNAPITPEQQAQLRADFEPIRETLTTSPAGFLHGAHDRATFDDAEDERQAFYEKMWNSPGFAKLISHYSDLLLDPAANAVWCEFLAQKIRSIVNDPDTANRLIPTDHRYGEHRPPFVTGYYEVYNQPNVSLVDLKRTPIVRVTATGIETAEGIRECDIIVWATGFDFGTGALNRMGVRGRNGLALEDHWADGPKTFLGVQTTGFPNFFFPGGPHAAAGNNPRYNGDQVDFITETLTYARGHGYDTIEVDPAAEEKWTDMVDRGATSPVSFGASSYYFGSNIPGKPRKYLLNSAGRPKLFKEIARVVDSGYKAFRLSRSAERTTNTG